MAAGAGDETFEDCGGDLFEYWHQAPMGDSAGVPGYHVHRATPDEFEAIRDLLDDAFGVRRPRTLYEWLYRKNPRGPARCFNLIEDATGELVATGAHFPWPAAVGDRRVPGQIHGDAAVRRKVCGNDWVGTSSANISVDGRWRRESWERVRTCRRTAP